MNQAMSNGPKDIDSIFCAAIEIVAAGERNAYLDKACGEDGELKRRLQKLLCAHESAGSFLSPSSPAVTATQPMQPAERPGMVIGPYKLLQQIGEGGMGTVYMAEQTHPVQRKVALKVIKPGMDSHLVIGRFEAERQALAMMDHINIARVLDAGATSSGRPYFVMELVRGVPITTYCDENHLSPRARLELFVPVCHAIQHAHQKGIIHRDIKPSNVMVTLYDGKPVPKVIDFGVAKATEQPLTGRTLFTQYGTMVGTLQYMSPEQAEMSALGVDTRSDIYSLGVLLYELLTGGTPLSPQRLKEAAYAEVLRMIREEEAPRPSSRLSDSGEALASISVQRHMEPAKLTKLMRGELDWIVMKTLEKDRNRRYETANGFAADVQRYLNDEAVQACPPSAGYRMGKFLRRNKGPVTAATLVLLALIGGMVGTTWGLVRAENARQAETKQRQIAEINEEKATDAAEQERIAKEKAVTAAIEERKQRDRADQNAETSRRHVYAAHMNLAQQAWQTGEVAKLVELLEGQRPLPAQEDLRSFDWYYLWRQSHRGFLRTLRGHLGPVYSVAYSPDGKLIASGSHDRSIRLWNSISGEELDTLWAHNTPVRSVAFSPDGKELATGSMDGVVRIWGVAGRELRAELQEHTARVNSVAFSPDGKTLASASSDRTVKLWDVALARERITLKEHTKEVLALAFSPDGKTLASGGYDFVVRLWNVDTGQQRAVLVVNNNRRGILTLAFSPDGKTVAVGDWGQVLRHFDVATHREQTQLQGHTGGIMSLAFAPDGKTLVTGSWDHTVKLWDVMTGQERSQGNLGSVHAVTFSPDGRTLATGGWDHTIQLWDVNSDQERTTLNQGLSVESLSVSPDSKTIAVASHDGTIKLWDAATGQERCILQSRTLKQWTHPYAHPHAAVAFSPDGKALASAGPDHFVKLWDVDTQQLRVSFEGHFGFLLTVAFSPDGKTVASGGSDRVIKLWDVAGGRERLTLKGHNDAVQSIAFSPVAKFLATASMMTQELKVWDSDTGRELTSLPCRAQVKDVTFSPSGQILVSAGNDGTVKLWDVATWEETMTIKAHSTAVTRVVFSHDGKVFATSSQDRSIKLWDLATGQERLVLQGHIRPILGLAFSADGQCLVSGSADGTINLWRAAIETEAVATKVNKSPLFYTDYMARARTSVRLGNFQQALVDFTTAVELTPLNPYANNELAWFLATCPDPHFRNYERAIQLAKKAIEQAAEQADFWTTLGAAQHRAGEYRQAVATLTRSTELNAGHLGTARPVDLAFLAMAHYRLGDAAKAREVLALIRERLNNNRWKADAESLSLLREAEALMEIGSR